MSTLLRWIVYGACGSLLCGCAALGTKARINAAVPPTSVRSMGFLIEDLRVGKSAYKRRIDSLFVETLMQQLTQNSGREVYFLGRLGNHVITTERLDSIARRNPRQDALVFCDIRLLSNDSLPNSRYANARVRLLLVKNPEQQLFARTSFNTRLGRSYWLNPTLPQALQDAVHGACRPLARYFQAEER